MHLTITVITIILCVIVYIPSVVVMVMPQINAVARRDDEIQAKLKSFKEAARCPNLSAANLPSICFYSIVNTKHRLLVMTGVIILIIHCVQFMCSVNI